MAIPAGDTNYAIERLEDQINWYARMSRYNQGWFKALKIWTIGSAALVPVLIAFNLKDVRISAALAASIALVEGIQQLNQYHANWISYRSTCEALKHEKYLFLSAAGPYSVTANAIPLLAERIEGLVSEEHAKWISTREQPATLGADSQPRS